MRELGTIQINGQNKKLSVKREGNLFKYYLEENFIGVFDPNKMIEEKIIFRENTIENELSAEAKDRIVQFLDEKQIEEIIDEEEQEKDEEINMDDSKAKSKKDREKEKDKDKDKEIEENKKQEREQQEKNPEKHINTVKDIDIKETVDVDERVTDMRNLKQVLRDAGKDVTINGKEIEKIGVVTSEQIDNLVDGNGNRESGHSSRYAVVGINNDGEVVNMDLEQDSSDGSNSSKRNYQISQDGEITKDDVSTRLKVGDGSLRYRE